MDEISEIQKLNLELIKRVKFNFFDGEQIVNDLLNHKHLWKSTVMTTCSGTSLSLVNLRDLSENIWNVDTLFILPEPGKEDELYQLTSKWSPDEIVWIGGELACSLLGEYSNDLMNNPRVILRLWWD